MANDVRGLLERWDRREGEPWTQSASGYRDLAGEALAAGHPMLASEVLREALSLHPSDHEVRYMAALANARIGCWREAAALVTPLLDEGAASGRLATDARSLAGRIAKDLWTRTPPGAERDRIGQEALAHYQGAWSDTRDPFPGINAATLAALTGRHDEATELARDVARRISEPTVVMEEMWREATLGEAAVLLEDFDEAERRYAAAAAAAAGRAGHVAAMRRQLALIGRHRAVPARVLEALAQPRVVTLAGSAAVREGAEADVASAIAEAFEALDAGFGYSSAAAGPDLLFVEAMLARGGEAHIVLPFDRQDFVGLSVASAGEGWVQRFDRALAGATTVGYAVREGFLGDRSLFRYAETLTRGAAMLRAEQLERAPVVLTLPGGVDDATLAQWRARGLEVGVLDVEEATGPAKPVSAFAGGLEREVKTMLFADVVGFTRLREEETPAFLVEFLGSIAEIVRTGVVRPAFVNTWGDGLFMVFDDVAAGADAALRVRDKVLGTDWRARGLPESTSVRVGMHSGPVFPATDPLLGRANFFGSHVNRAARIEPVAAPGTVYVSEAMACLLAASGEVRFATDYLGTIPLAKGFDSSPLYRLRRADAAE